jgi:hypothetical protein
MIDIFVPRARGLSRCGLLRAPSAFVEVHYRLGSPPIAVSSHSIRQTSPTWGDFAARIELDDDQLPPIDISVVVRNAANKGSPVIGSCSLRIEATITEGWYPLVRDDASVSTAEVYLSVEWAKFCGWKHWHESLALPSAPHEATDDDEAEIRSVSDEPGRFFRCGELVATVKTMNTPSTTREPQLLLALHDQRLRGYTDDTESDCKKFGSFAFALVQGAFPDNIRLVLNDSASKMPPPVNTVADATLQLPTSIPGFEPVPCSGSCKEDMHYVLQFRASNSGLGSSKVTFDVRIVSSAICSLDSQGFLSMPGSGG